MKRMMIAAGIALSLSAIQAQAASTYAQTKYPVVLAHGKIGRAHV